MVLGVEIGGTKQQIAVCDGEANLIEMVSGKPDISRGAPDILDWLQEHIEQLLKKYEISAIGIGFGAAYFGNTYACDPPVRIEDLCSGPAIERRLREGIPAESCMTEPTCRALHAAAQEGDAFALSVLEDVGRHFGIGIANVVSMLGVDRVAIGGGVANMGEYIVDPIRRYANEYVFLSGRDRFEVETCQLLDDNVPLGAALFAIHGFESL